MSNTKKSQKVLLNVLASQQVHSEAIWAGQKLSNEIFSCQKTSFHQNENILQECTYSDKFNSAKTYLSFVIIMEH